MLPHADAPVSSTRMRVAAATALGAAAVKAKMLADAEEREVQRQVQIAVEAQMQKVQLKLNSMKQLDEALEKERSTMEVSTSFLALWTCTKSCCCLQSSLICRLVQLITSEANRLCWCILPCRRWKAKSESKSVHTSLGMHDVFVLAAD